MCVIRYQPSQSANRCRITNALVTGSLQFVIGNIALRISNYFRPTYFLMKQLLLFSSFVFLLLLGSSCAEDIAEDGTKRGRLVYIGNVKENGKEYTVFVYNRSETIESSDQGSATFWYWLTYTVDTKTGKIVRQTEYDVDEDSGSFLGISGKYAFFLRTDGVSAIDLHKDNSVIDPVALKKRIGRKTAKLKGTIAYMETDGYNSLRVTTKKGDIYLLNPTTLEGRLICDGLNLNPDFQMKLKLPDYGNSVLINGRIHCYVANDTTTLALESYDPNNTHKRFLYTLHHSSRKNFYEMIRTMTHTKADSTVFLDGSMLGLKDSVVTVEYLSALGNTGVQKIGAYSLTERKFLWSKPANSLYEYSDMGNYYVLYWNEDGNSFFIYSQENAYKPVSLVNAKTGNIIWKF